jgi:putative ABC transport system permease protein
MHGVPIRYSLRNLARRPVRTGLTVLGLSLVVGLIVFIAAFGRSIARTVRVTGDPRNLVVVSKKAQSMELSSIAPSDLDLMANDVADDLQTGPDGPLFSREVFRFEEIRIADGPDRRRAKIYGIRPELAASMLAGFRLVEGDLPEPGAEEMLVGPHVARDLGVSEDRLAIGERLGIGDSVYRIVGRFEAPGSLVEHWLLADVEDLRLTIRRRDYSFARMKVREDVDLDALAKRLSLDESYQVRVLPERASPVSRASPSSSPSSWRSAAC